MKTEKVGAESPKTIYKQQRCGHETKAACAECGKCFACCKCVEVGAESGAQPDQEVKLHDTMDAMIWAKEFKRICDEKGYYCDEDWMLSWFANAIMVGWDHANQKAARELAKHAPLSTGLGRPMTPLAPEEVEKSDASDSAGGSIQPECTCRFLNIGCEVHDARELAKHAPLQIVMQFAEAYADYRLKVVSDEKAD